MLASFATANKANKGQNERRKKKLVEDLEKLLFEEIPEMETPKIRRCEWCHQSLPNDRYHLKICPQCRTESITSFMKTR